MCEGNNGREESFVVRGGKKRVSLDVLSSPLIALWIQSCLLCRWRAQRAAVLGISQENVEGGNINT